jgi:hypothetical protein
VLYNGKVAPDPSNNVNGRLVGRGATRSAPNWPRPGKGRVEDNWVNSLRAGQISFVSAPLAEQNFRAKKSDSKENLSGLPKGRPPSGKPPALRHKKRGSVRFLEVPFIPKAGALGRPLSARTFDSGFPSQASRKVEPVVKKRAVSA